MKLSLYIIALWGLLSVPELRAQDFNFPDASSLSLGQIRSTEQNIYSTMTNPAGLAGVQTAGIAFSYTAPYNIHKLSNRSITATMPSKYGSFSFLFTQAGYSLSLINRYGFSYSRQFGKHVSAALMFNGLTHKLNGTDTYGGFFSVIGLQLFPSEHVDIGFYIRNVEQSKISYPDRKELIPILYIAGAKWHPVDDIALMAEVEKDQQFRARYKFGIQYIPVEMLVLRGGVMGSPVEISFGTGLKWSFVVIDIGISYHQQLGVTSGASIAFSLPAKSKR